MSRIGRMPVPIPATVKVEVRDRTVHVEGPKGQLDFQLPRQTQVTIETDVAHVKRSGDDGRARAAHGLTRAVLYNMVQVGVGFKASVQGGKVNMSLGYSHPIAYPIPDQIKVTVDDNTKITIEGPSKEVVGRVASELRAYYPPEPYKGKGVRYAGEHIIRKEGKTVQ